MVEEATMPNPHILVVDDEPHYRYILRVNLEARGYEVTSASTGRQAVDLHAALDPDLVLLDLLLPDVDGLEVCRAIRTYSTVPILMLTALTEPPDRVRGLDCGADDYIPKPFDVDELLARVEAALRRLEYDRHPSSLEGGQGRRALHNVPLSIGALRIDPLTCQAHVGDHRLPLTPTEYRLLFELVRACGRVLTYEQLLERVWGDGDPEQQYLVHQAISRLRRKLAAAPACPIIIDTQYGTGYLCRPA
jgi:DNA-binding response OmpR family regulator